MSKVTQDIILGEGPSTPKVDEEAAVVGSSSKDDRASPPPKDETRRNFIGVLLALVALALIIGLSVGLTQNNDEDKTPTTQTTSNVEIFDIAVALVKSTERQFKVLTSGETMSYREYNADQPHVLVLLPGYLHNDVMFSIMAVLPELADHHLIAVNPRGWEGSTMNTPISSHEENADEVVELLNMMGVKEAMVGGHSTGGGIAFHMTHKYPDMIKAAFLIHSIPLDGFRAFDDGGKPIKAEDIGSSWANMFPDDIDSDAMYELAKAYSPGFPSPDHEIFPYLFEGVKMPGKVEAMVNNANFNVSPIKTPYAEPSDALSTLKSKIIVIHGDKDFGVDAEQVKFLTKLAINENWAPPGLLSYYDDGEGHFPFYDNPSTLGTIYRQAFEEQIANDESV